jgi:PAS domain S-box-containing protein
VTTDVELENERFRIAVAHSPIVLYESLPDGTLTWIYNSQLERLTGSMIGRRLNELMTPETAAELERAKRLVLDTGERHAFEGAVEVNGVRRHLWLSFAPRRDATGAIVGLIGSSVDITDRIEYRDRMIGILGHDLRNPLAAIQGVVGVLRLDASLAEAVRKGLAQVDKAARRMNEMIQTVLDFTRARFHGELPIVRHPMSLHELCQTAIDDALAAAPGTAFRLVAEGDVRGSWDQARLAQVVGNLVGNAVAHGDSTAPIEIAVRGGADAVTLAVSNRGLTIAAADKLFEPFERGERRGKGLGLGLYIARRIASSHGGMLDVTSAGGTITFTLRLPRT